MKIDHLAIWVDDIERMKEFYVHYFNAECSDKYINEMKEFSSYFLSFDSGARIELMHQPDIFKKIDNNNKTVGLAHFALSVGNREEVDKLTELFREDGFEIKGEPRTTGDGCYESVILDPEGNTIEITE